MRLFLVIGETPFYVPEFVRDLMDLTGEQDDWVGAAVITKVPEKGDIELYLKRNWRFLRPTEIAKLAAHKYLAMLKDKFLGARSNVSFYSVRKLLTVRGVGWFPVEMDINRPEVVARIAAMRPDVIVNSGSLIFREPIFKVPKICCLNRHSALLPAYGGLWPVFHAYRAGETEVGVSASIMVAGIDEGPVLAQRAMPIEPMDTLYDLYEKTFKASAPVVAEALDRVRRGDLSGIENDYMRSYYSFPTADHWRAFRRRGGRFI